MRHGCLRAAHGCVLSLSCMLLARAALTACVFGWRCPPLRTFSLFSHFDSAPVDSSWRYGWIARRLRAIALMQLMRRLTNNKRGAKSNYEGNAALSALRFIGAFVNDRTLGRPGTLCLAPIAAEQ